jgi:molybdopterin synthase catalytic subunit
MAYLTDESIDTPALVRRAMRRSDGACVVFEGAVRDHHEGHAVESIEYEAYRPMAEKELAAVVGTVRRTHPETSVELLHRVGHLVVGEVSIAIVCCSPHRAEAFDACRLAIDEIKQSVPIWKKERGPFGEEWVGWQK